MDSDLQFEEMLNGGSVQYDASSHRYGSAEYVIPYGGSSGNGYGYSGGGSVEEPDEGGGNKHLQWTDDDNLKLISAWLNNSVDPIDGNGKKGEVYWKEVTKEFNENNPANRRRKPQHCKDHWGKMNRKIVPFNGMWCRLRDVYVSGQSDDQLMRKSHDLYKSETKQTFTLVNQWKQLRHQPKWSRFYVEENNLEGNDPIEVDIAKETRSGGSKGEKEKRKGKGKRSSDFSSSSLSHDDIQLYYDTQALRASTTDKSAEVKLELSREKHRTAEARERVANVTSEKAIMEKYMELLMTNTTCMSDLHKSEHEMSPQFFRRKIMGAENEDISAQH